MRTSTQQLSSFLGRVVWFLGFSTVLLSLSTCVRAETVYDSEEILKDPRPCISINTVEGLLRPPKQEDQVLVPVEAIVECLREKVSIRESFAVDSIDAYNDVLKGGYGYYYFNDDVLKSTAISNPYGWEIYNGSLGGQVNYDEEFQKLKQEVMRNGSATGMLAYQISDILLRARDAHTNPVTWDFGSQYIVDENKARGGDSPSRWLSMHMSEDGEVQVITRVSESTSQEYGVPEVKVVASINGNTDPVGFLRNLTDNPSLGTSSQFKSSGVRLNAFLSYFHTDPESSVIFGPSDAGDISKIPAYLNITYDDGSGDWWGFRVSTPADYIFLPPQGIEDILEYTGDAYALYTDLFGPRPQGQLPNVTSSMGSSKQERKRLRKYEIVPDVLIMDDADSSLGFTVFNDITTKDAEIFSAYTVYEDVMVWKLPTFGGPSSFGDAFNFWNTMVDEANEKNITTLLIDISDNGGGFVTLPYTNLVLLYPDATFEDIAHKFTLRINDPLLKLDVAYDYYVDILDALLAGPEVINATLTEADPRELIDILDELLNHYSSIQSLSLTLSGSLNTWGGWYAANVSSLSSIKQLLDGVSLQDVDESFIIEILENFRFLIQPPIEECPMLAEDQISLNQNSSCFEVQNQGGTDVLSTKPQRHINPTTFSQDDLDFINERRNAPSENIRRSPFNEYILLSNSALVGSSSNIFESGMRHLSRVYGNGTGGPTTTTVSMGCFGEKDDCDMTSFQGAVDAGNSELSMYYSFFGAMDTLAGFLESMPADALEELGITEKNVSQYVTAVEAFKDSLPAPPTITDTLPQFNHLAIYSQEIPEPSIPQEFFKRPADKYLPIWPAPGSMKLDDQSALADVYSQVLGLFSE